MRWISTVSRYQDNFSCRIAFVARAFLGVTGAPFAEPFMAFDSSLWGVRITSERSVTTSNIRGFSRWKDSSKYTFGIEDNGATARWVRLETPLLDLRLMNCGESIGDSTFRGDCGSVWWVESK